MTETTTISKEQLGPMSNRVVDLVASEVAHYSPNFVFGVTGDKVEAQIDAFIRGGFRFILTHDEVNAALMASVVARLTGKLGVCMGMGAPGAARLVPGLLQAAIDRVPVLAISGNVESYNLGTDYTQEANLLEMFRVATVYNQMIFSPKSAGVLARIACRTAFAKNGVSHLSIPVDIANAVVTESDGGGTSSEAQDDETNRILAPPSPRPEIIEQAAKLINESGNIIILAGKGTSGHAELVSKLGQKLQAPIFTTLNSMNSLPPSNPNNVGVLWWSSWVVRKAIQDVNTVLMIGTDYPYTHHIFSKKTTKIIQIDSNQFSLGKRMVTLPVLGDAGESMRALLPLLRQRQDSSFLNKAHEIISEHQTKADVERNDTTRKPINPYYLTKTLETLLPEDCVITLDGGSVEMYFATGFDSKKRILVPGGRYSTLGFGLPAALAAKLVYPEREVIACCGDFGMIYTINEMVTAVQNKLPVKSIVFNNRIQLTVHNAIKNKRLILPEDSGELDFAKAAEACGATGRTVDDPKDLKSSIEELLSIKGAALLDVRTSPEITSTQNRTRMT